MSIKNGMDNCFNYNTAHMCLYKCWPNGNQNKGLRVPQIRSKPKYREFTISNRHIKQAYRILVDSN
ncbi:MAG: hypothetical protein ACRCX2_22375 [Paraclostridium sp.]